MSLQYQIPATPRITSPTPPPSDSTEGRDGYFAPIIRSKSGVRSAPPIDEEDQDDEESSDSSLEKRARTRSRSPKAAGKARRMSGLTAANSKSGPSASRTKKKPEPLIPNGKPIANGNLSPSSAATSYWREFSRSPSPLGLIPIHRHWRSFVSRDIPHSPSTAPARILTASFLPSDPPPRDPPQDPAPLHRLHNPTTLHQRHPNHKHHPLPPLRPNPHRLHRLPTPQLFRLQPLLHPRPRCADARIRSRRLERRHLVPARRLDRPALLPQRRRRHGRPPAQLVRHRRQHRGQTLRPLHAAHPQGEEPCRQRSGLRRWHCHRSRVLGLAGASHGDVSGRSGQRVHVYGSLAAP